MKPLRLCAVALLGLTCAAATPTLAEQVVVGSAAQLMAALKAARAGQTILLTPGTYNIPAIQKFDAGGNVTIASQDRAHPALLTGLEVFGGGGLTFSRLEITTVGSGDAHYGLRVAEAKDVAFMDDSIHGSLDANPRNDISGLYITDSSNVTVQGCRFQQLRNAVVQLRNTHLTIIGNAFHDIQIDGVDGGGSSFVTITGNLFTNFYPEGEVGGSGDHADAIQFWTTNTTTPATDIVITDNLFVRGKGSHIQGVFINDEAGVPYQRVTVTGNMIIGGLYNGVDVVDATDLNVSDNTVGAFTDMGSWLRVEGSSGVAAGNRATNYVWERNRGLKQSKNATILEVTDGGKALVAAFLAAHVDMKAMAPAGMATAP